MITLTAEAAYGYEKKQYVARIEGRDSKFTFRREFVGRRSGKRDQYTEAGVDEPGLYEVRNIDRKGNKESLYRLVVQHEGKFVSLPIKGAAIDVPESGEERAREIAKRLDSENGDIAKIIEIVATDEGLKYRVR